MMTDPWDRISVAVEAGQLTAIRVDPDHPWNFFWARDSDGRRLLTLRHGYRSSEELGFPKLRGVEVYRAPVGNNDEHLLVWRLMEDSNSDVFLTLCEDIVGATASAPDEKVAVRLALRRTWRWHHLLRVGRDRRLSPEEQKGLIGELIVLDRHVLKKLSALEAVRSWSGPEGAPKDFEIGEIAIEAKARRGSAKPYVAISSEFQLDASGVNLLVLHVVNLVEDPGNGNGSSVQEFAERIRTLIERSDVSAADLFDQKLLAAGLRPEDSYESERWLEGESKIFRVELDFPRITASSVPLGVSAVGYSLDIAHLGAFEIDESALNGLIMGAIGAD